jgi:hypothetical protein
VIQGDAHQLEGRAPAPGGVFHHFAQD